MNSPFAFSRDVSLGRLCKHHLEGAVYYPYLGSQISIPRAINFPCPQETKSRHSSNVVVMTLPQRDKYKNTYFIELDGT